MWPFSRKAPTDGKNLRRPLPRNGRDPHSLGADGEKLARKLLRRMGYKVLAENYRCPSGEIDLIALDPTTAKTLGAETIVFVEVKTRSCDRFVSPQSAVNSAKKEQIRSAAGYYLRTHDGDGFLTRYDVVAIVQPPGEDPRVEHIPNAFE